jgi:hypothetical protein
MNIIDITYTNAENTLIKITTDDTVFFAPYPCHTWHATAINAWVASNTIGDYVAPSAPIVYISKLTIIDRLIGLDKINDALTALNSNIVAKARWDASVEIAVDDADVIALLTSISVNPEDVLY